MTKDVEELFVSEVEVGVANLDMSADEGVVSTRAVVQRTTVHDRDTGHQRELLLVYDPVNVAAVADALRNASKRASADQTL